MVQGSPSLPTLAAAPAKAVLAVEGTLPDGETATSPCPSRAAAGRCPTVAADLRVRATSVPAYGVAPDRRPSRGVG